MSKVDSFLPHERLRNVYVRFEAATKNSRGAAPGVFALANRLAHSGALNEEDHAWWRASNDWMDAAYPDPGSRDVTMFDRDIHPHTECWFKLSAVHLLTRTHQYLELLDRYDVSWVERRCSDPGPILYEDRFQIVIDAREGIAPAHSALMGC